MYLIIMPFLFFKYTLYTSLVIISCFTVTVSDLFLKQYFLWSVYGAGEFILGTNVNWIYPFMVGARNTTDPQQSPLPHLLTESQISLVATFAYLGAIPGPYITVWLSNSKGRKPCFVIGGVGVALAYTMMALSRSLAMLYVSRFLAGLALGVIGVMNLVYIGEIASTNIRGVLLSALGIFMTLGSILMFSFGPFVSYQATTYLPLFLSLVYTFCVLWLPDTPIFYMLKGDDAAVVKVLQDLDRLEDRDKLLKITKAVTATNAKNGWIELFSTKSNRRALFIVVVINIFQHCSGVLAVIFFSAAIFEMAGSSISSNLSMIVICCFQLCGSTVTPLFIERTGRRLILAVSSAVCSLSMFVLGLYFYLDGIGNTVIENVKWLPLVLLILFYIGYDSGLGIIPNTIMGEMFSSDARSKGSTVTMSTSWVFGFLVTTAFGALLEAVGGHVAFWFFSGTCAGAALFTMFFIPETKGRTLIEIQESLS